MSRDEITDETAPASASELDAGATVPGGRDSVAAGIDVGATLGRYVLRERLGEGGMGAVFAAHDPGLDRIVAVKVLRPGAATESGEPHLRLEREGRVMARLSHPNVIQVFDVGYAHGSVFVAMEYVRGGTLKDWLAARPRRVPEILALFVQAARGLAAAHDAGFVHRDFKPSNVMVGDDGRVLVTDFGLARVAERAAPATPTSGDPLHLTLTRGNAIVGTPQYMAPEQYRGGTIDGRADQFAFSVALWQALYGVAPFPGETWRELAEAVRAGRRTEPPPAPVPARVRAALERGLAIEPDARFPSMDALIDALAPAPASRARWVALGAAALVAGGIALWAVTRGDAGDPCASTADRFAGTWDEDARAAVRASFDASGVPFADSAFREVARQLDLRRAGWLAMRRDSCEATRVRREQTDAAMDLRAACLDRRFGELSAFVAVLRAADRGVVESAAERAGRIGDVAGCADVAALQRRAAPPADRAGELAALERALAAARARAEAGHAADVAAEAGALLERARAAAYPPVLAEALAVAALVAQRQDRPGDAETLLEEAVLAAEEGGDDEQRFGLLLELAVVVGTHLERDGDGGRQVERARAVQRRLGDDRPREARLARTASMHEWTHGRYAVARGHAEHAIALLEAIDPSGAEMVRALHMLAIILDELNDASAELPVIERAVPIAETAFGRQHPMYARILQTHSGALRRLDRLDEAEVAIRAAIAVLEATDGPRAASTGGAYMNLGNFQRDRGDLPGAVASFRTALAIMEASAGPEHTRTANVLDNLGSALSKHGEHEEGQRLLERSIAVYTARIGADAPPTAGAVRHLAEHHVRTGRLDLAIPLYEEAIRAVEASDGKASRMLVRPLLGLGETHLAHGDRAGATAALERCVAVVGDDAYHADLAASCRAALARARAGN